MTGTTRPDVSYVLAAASADEVHAALGWLRLNPLADGVEIILAAPAAALAQVAASAVPRRIGLVAAAGCGRTEVRIAGARSTTGQVVVAIDCSEDLAARLGDRLAAEQPQADVGLLGDIDTDLPPVVGHIGSLPAVAAGFSPR